MGCGCSGGGRSKKTASQPSNASIRSLVSSQNGRSASVNSTTPISKATLADRKRIEQLQRDAIKRRFGK